MGKDCKSMTIEEAEQGGCGKYYMPVNGNGGSQYTQCTNDGKKCKAGKDTCTLQDPVCLGFRSEYMFLGWGPEGDYDSDIKCKNRPKREHFRCEEYFHYFMD